MDEIATLKKQIEALRDLIDQVVYWENQARVYPEKYLETFRAFCGNTLPLSVLGLGLGPRLPKEMRL